MVNRDDIARSIIRAGLTFTIEQDPIYMRERPLNDVVDAVMGVIERQSDEQA